MTRVDNPEATDSTKVPIASTGVRITSTVAPTWKVIEPSTSSRRIRTVERALTRSASIVATVRSAHSEGRFRRRRVATRSEEHTSELQSRGQLVCRLPLEKENIDRYRAES